MVIRFCPNCGNKLIEGAAFCPSCGSKIQINQEPAGQTAPVAEESERAQDILKRFGIRNGVYKADEEEQSNKPEQNKPIPDNSPLITDEQTDVYSEINSNEELLPPNPDEILPEAPQAEQSIDDEVQKKQERLDEARRSKAEAASARRKNKPQKKQKSVTNRFLIGRYADEESADSSPIIVKDNLYNQSIQEDYDAEVDAEIEEETSKERASEIRSRSANTVSNIKGRAHKASSIIVDKAAGVAGKHLITEDKALENRRKVYIIEQEQMADPDDPDYDGYYENILPIDADSDDKGKTGESSKFTLNDESKKTILILIALLAALVVVVVTQF